MNLNRLQKKVDKGLSQEYEKDIIVQHKNSKSTLPKIAYTDMMDICEAECPDDTSHVDMEEGVNDIKDDNNEKK